MMTLCIRYTLDVNKLADFEAYARALPQPVERCGGKFIAFYLPTKIAGPTNTAWGLIEFPDLASYERYREKLMADSEWRRKLTPSGGRGLHLERGTLVRPPHSRITEDVAHHA